MKVECPLLKDKKKFKKRMREVIWDGTNSSSTENEEEKEVTNMCFMVIDGDEVYFTNDESKSSYLELENAKF